MTAMSFISEPHFGQINGSTSYTYAISLAHAERQARWGRICLRANPGTPSSCSACDSFQSAGATRATWGKRCHRALHREEYKPY
jgi:hypothetical protein